MNIFRWFAAAALLAGSGAASAQTAVTTPCISRPDATALLTTFLPDILTAAAVRCGPALPPSAALRQGLPGLIAHFQADSDQAWPRAVQAIGQLTPVQLRGVSPEVLRPLATTVVVPLVAGRIAVRDCARLDQAVALLSPLPARNLAELAVLAIESDANRHPQATGLPLCLDRR